MQKMRDAFPGSHASRTDDGRRDGDKQESSTFWDGKTAGVCVRVCVNTDGA